MKVLEWQRFFQEQRDQHGKVLFTPTELANSDGCSGASLRVALQRLVARGVVRRYTDGRYGLPGAVSVEELVPSIDPAAYVTGMYALYRHQLVTQATSEIRCFTNRRHNRSRERTTPLGRIVFVCITGRVYEYPGSSAIAGPEQALCDFVYDCRKRGIDPRDLVTFRNIDRLDPEVLSLNFSRYPKTVLLGVSRITERFLATSRG